jgi:hypothetical protein
MAFDTPAVPAAQASHDPFGMASVGASLAGGGGGGEDVCVGV